VREDSSRKVWGFYKAETKKIPITYLGAIGIF